LDSTLDRSKWDPCLADSIFERAMSEQRPLLNFVSLETQLQIVPEANLEPTVRLFCPSKETQGSAKTTMMLKER
jgi:hypothetical protein